MRTLDLILYSLLSLVYYLIFVIDKIITCLSFKSTPSFKAWIEDKYELNLKRNSFIRVVLMLLVMTLILII